MTAPRRPPWILLLALPVWLATALPVSGQTLTADINGDGVSDRIDVGRTAGELLVRLSGAGPAHHFRIPGLAPDGSVAALGHGGESKLLLTSIGRRYVRLLAWVSAGTLAVRVPAAFVAGRKRLAASRARRNAGRRPDARRFRRRCHLAGHGSGARPPPVGGARQPPARPRRAVLHAPSQSAARPARSAGPSAPPITFDSCDPVIALAIRGVRRVRPERWRAAAA